MKKNNTSDHDNTIEIITYSVIGGAICLSLMPGYIPYAICCGGILGSLYGIGKILDKYKDVEDMNFVSKESIKYFNNKK